MPSFNMSVPNPLGQEEALSKIQNLLGQVKEEHGDKISDLQESWSGNTGTFSLTAMGMKVSGTLAVKPDEVTIDGNIPFAAVPFKGQIEKVIREQAEKVLTPAASAPTQ
jgi:hypothetical protein